MAMLLNIIHKIRSISLKWKILIPFLSLAFLVVTTIVYIGLSSQDKLIKREEQKEILDLYHVFLAGIRYKADQALSTATAIAGDTRVRELLADRDRAALLAYSTPIFRLLKKDFGIRQFHFHTAQEDSFLRVHRPHMFGEVISYRKAIMDAMKSGRGIASLERGLTGLGIRGVAPVYHGGNLVGSFEIGYPFREMFLQKLKENWGSDFTIYQKRGEDLYSLLASTMRPERPSPFVRDFLDGAVGDPVIMVAPPSHPDRSILFGPIRDYLGKVVALVQIDTDRSAIVRELSRTTGMMVLLGLAGVLVSFFVIFVVAILFTRPIEEIVANARAIAEGRRATLLKRGPDDEIGLLTQSLNTMLNVLKERQTRIEDYAKTLERRVRERTADLVSSEEKYRTLVDNLPLCVYRILDDGTTEFINPYFTEKLGYVADEAIGDRRFWPEAIWGYEKSQDGEVPGELAEDTEGFRVERSVRDKQGNRHVFIDHAIPSRNDQGRLKWLDGIMVDITTIKRLQERALQTEENRLLRDISARFAHEMRNPVATAGGFARLLRDSLPKGEKSRKFAKIIVEEVARLEHILKILLSAIKPFTLTFSEVDVNQLIRSSLQELGDQINAKRIDLEESVPPSLPNIRGDEEFLKRAFDSILRNAVMSVPDGERLSISTLKEDKNLVVVVKHRAKGLAEEDLQQFFFPRLTGRPEHSIDDLPLSNIIIHRHGGKIDAYREGEAFVVLRIELPVSASG